MKMNEILKENDSLSTVRIFDNGSDINYRYTVYFPSADYHIVMSEYPNVPRGIYNKAGGRPQQNEKLGKEININQVSSDAKEKIMQELQGHQKAAFL